MVLIFLAPIYFDTSVVGIIYLNLEHKDNLIISIFISLSSSNSLWRPGFKF
uniref:Uncharacterized protein n=1 Tax=Rhizophora mucronata TaxID=61149 RepID=A0A2P2P7T9_RHIMU